jgi:hypothetical protein
MVELIISPLQGFIAFWYALGYNLCTPSGLNSNIT